MLKKRIIYVGVMLLLAGLWLFRFIHLNQAYPRPKLLEKKVGEVIAYTRDVDICVTKTRFLSRSEDTRLMEAVSDTDTGEKDDILIVQMEAVNHSDKESLLDLTEMCLEAEGYTNGVGMTEFSTLNQGEPLRQTLAPEEKKVFEIPYLFYYSDRSKRETLLAYDFFVTYKLYPEKCRIAIGPMQEKKEKK
ncbi:hypothetical protein [Suipraeoptans intestinalis]|uniref:hypothetical protein n=1 Tax=Suipraeoptans intestinalis TaxID=2606628 RepID=UPI0023F47E01|nr:hypothetical protein [Suipraeoptans intestinalis]MDD7769508.1 hypothetical protein [Suipraeoptans intestinalis]